jgi:hypothetical protein
MTEQEAKDMARHIERDEPLFVVREVGWRERDKAWAVKVYDPITERQVVISDVRSWPRLRDAARREQRQLVEPAYNTSGEHPVVDARRRADASRFMAG